MRALRTSRFGSSRTIRSRTRAPAGARRSADTWRGIWLGQLPRQRATPRPHRRRAHATAAGTGSAETGFGRCTPGAPRA
eukprot:4175510-Prymnesium_polylepis.5